MRHVFVRPIRQDEAQQFVKWSSETPNNLFDARAGLYRTSRSFAAYNADKVIAYVPAQVPIFMEALAFNPEATELEKAAALKALTQFLVSLCHLEGRGEIYFLCEDPPTQEFAARQQFEELPWKLYRIRLADLEKRNVTDAHL